MYNVYKKENGQERYTFPDGGKTGKTANLPTEKSFKTSVQAIFAGSFYFVTLSGKVYLS